MKRELLFKLIENFAFIVRNQKTKDNLFDPKSIVRPGEFYIISRFQCFEILERGKEKDPKPLASLTCVQLSRIFSITDPLQI